MLTSPKTHIKYRFNQKLTCIINTWWLTQQSPIKTAASKLKMRQQSLKMRQQDNQSINFSSLHSNRQESLLFDASDNLLSCYDFH